MADKTRIGIMSFAHMHADAYAWALRGKDNIDFVGCTDPDVERGMARAQQFETIYAPTAEALLRDNLDGVIITSENIYHRPLVEQCAKAGVKAILCEKPLATTVADAQAMIDVCGEHGVKLATAFPCRYSPAFVEMKNLVQSGGIGEVLAIRGTNRGRKPPGWFTDVALSGGGAVIDHAVHVADLNRLLLGREAVEVHAEIDNRFFHGKFDDTGFLTITYDGGVFSTLDTTWSRPKTWPTWGDITMQLLGTEGVVEMDMFAQALGHYDDTANAIAWPGWGSNIDALMVADFVRLINGATDTALATGEDGLRALEVALAAYRSSDLKQPVKV